jgi:hypothetical protein
MAILAALRGGMRGVDVAAAFGLHKSRISQIKRRYSLTGNLTPTPTDDRPAA